MNNNTITEKLIKTLSIDNVDFNLYNHVDNQKSTIEIINATNTDISYFYIVDRENAITHLTKETRELSVKGKDYYMLSLKYRILKKKNEELEKQLEEKILIEKQLENILKELEYKEEV